MAKRSRQPLISYLSEPHEVMSIDESETLLDSSLTSSLNVYPGGEPPPSIPLPGYTRDNSLGSINTQSTTLTGNSKFMSPAVTVVDIDLKATRSIDEFDEIQQRTTTSTHQRRLRHRRSYEGVNEEKTKSSSMLLSIDTSSQSVSREGLQPQASGEKKWTN